MRLYCGTPLQSVLYHQKVFCEGDLMFFVIWLWCFWCLVKFCLILSSNFFMLQHQFPLFFNLCVWFFTFMSKLLSFQLMFNHFFYIFEHEHHHFPIIIILVQFFLCFLLSYLYRCQGFSF